MAKRNSGQIVCNGKQYRSQKHPLFEYIIHRYNPNNDTSIKHIVFTLADISEAYRNTEIYRIDISGNKNRITEPASISNTILDLVRQDRGAKARMPDSLIELGYDLRKKTGSNIAGEFVFVGLGNQLSSWMTWGGDPEMVVISSELLPELILDFLRKDEGALFSVIDYCDVLSQALFKQPNTIIRVQHPLKWQPNEIDGFYVGVIIKV